MAFMRFAGLLALYCTLFVHSYTNLPDLLSEKGISFTAPGHPDYLNFTTPYNRRYTLRPAAVTFPTTRDQVADVIKIGSAVDHSVVAQSGGHSYVANGLGGKSGSIVVDLRALKDITLDPNSNIARVGTGNRLGDIALTLAAHGRGIPHGTCPYIGIGGHAAHGGYGFPSRMWGLTLDHTVSVDLVLANGSLVTVSEHQHPDLFWAIRGAGSSYGIATSIEFRTHPVPPSGLVFTYTWLLNVQDAASALDDFQNFIQSDIPAELGPMLYFLPGTPRGQVQFGLTGGWYGDVQKLNSTLDPFLNKMGPPSNVIYQSGTYIESLQFPGAGFNMSLNTSLAPDTHDTFYAKSIVTPENKTVSRKAWEELMSFLAYEGNATSVLWAVEIEVWGGTNSAVDSVSFSDTAFAHRSSLFTFQLYVSSPNREPPYPQEGFDFANGMADSIINNNPPDWNYGTYTNYIDDRLPDWQKRYYASHYQRLQLVKQTVDPSNVFSFPMSIEL